jgi:prepilin-type N-terminal cleavage/methylation domain-containing protein
MLKTLSKAFTLIEILITLAIISLVMLGISGLSWAQVNKMREKIVRENFISTYNAVLLNSIGSSNIDGQGKKNTLVIYDGVVATTGLDTKPEWISDYLLMRNGLKRNATIIFDNYALGCSIDGQSGMQEVNFNLMMNNEKTPQIGCFSIDLGTCKLLERRC